MVTELTRHRRDFWDAFAERQPDLYRRTTRGNETTRWLTVEPWPLVASLYIGAGAVGIFVRGPRGFRADFTREQVFPHRAFLLRALGDERIRLGNRFLLEQNRRFVMQDQTVWPAAIDWLADRAAVYERALEDVQKR